MGKIVRIPTKETGSWLENLALAHNLLDEDKPEECLVLLNKLEYDGTDAEMLRGKAFFALRNHALSNYHFFKAIKSYLSKGGKMTDAFLAQTVSNVVYNCVELKKYEAAAYYLAVSKRRADAGDKSESKYSIENAFTEFALTERVRSASDDDISLDILPDMDLFGKFVKVKKHTAKGQYDKAIKILKDLLPNAGEYTLTIRLMLARCYYDNCDYEECISECRGVLNEFPTNVKAQCLLCKSAVRSDENALAEATADKLVAEGGIEDNDDIYDIAELFIELKYYKRLLDYSERLIEYDDGDYLFVKINALALHLNGDTLRALKILNRQASLFGESDDARFIVYYMKNYPDAEIYPELETFYPDEMDAEMNDRMTKCKDLAENIETDKDAEKFARMLDENALAIDYVARYGASGEEGNWDYLTIVEELALNSASYDRKQIERLEDRLLDEDLALEIREMTMHALLLDEERYFVYYVNNGKLYRADRRLPAELDALPRKFDAFIEAYRLMKCKLALRYRNEPYKLDDAACAIAKALKKRKLTEKISSPLTYVKMFKFFIDNYDYDNGEELAAAVCDLDAVENVDIDDLMG